MTRGVCLVLVLLAGGCRCGHPLGQVVKTVTVTPPALEFGAVPVGQRLHSRLAVTAGQAPVSAQLELGAGAFAVDPAAFELQAGESKDIDVVFAPASLGRASATLTARGGERAVSVALSGAGVAACPAAAQCHQVTFDPTSHSCLDAQLPDHSPCEGVCISGGECRGGTCVGSSVACDDGDPCTDDACSTDDGGCVHFEHLCPVTSACRTAVCFSDAGCTEQPVDDGTSCGSSDCLQSQVCLADVCVTLPTRGGAADCRYTSVAGSENSQTCATTVSGALRCWGEWRAPHRVAGAGGAQRVAAASLLGGSSTSGEHVCTVDASGFDVRCFGFAGPDGGLGSPVRELDPPCAVLEDDRYVCWDLSTGVATTLASGVRSATVAYGAYGYGSGQFIRCLLLTDAGIECEASFPNRAPAPIDPPFTTAPDRFVVPSVSDAICGEWPDTLRCSLGYVRDLGDGGTAVFWAHDYFFDAGWVLGGGGTLGPGLLAQGNQVDGENGQPSVISADPVVQLTSTLYFETPCLLTDRQEVWCWGSDAYGGLGQLTGNPQGLQPLPIDADQLLAGSESTLAIWDGGIWQVGGTIPELFDSRFVPKQTNLLLMLDAGTSLDHLAVHGLCGIFDDGRGWCLRTSWSGANDYDQRVDLGPARAIADLLGSNAGDLAVLRPSGRVELIDGGLIADGVTRLVRGAVLRADGGVSSWQAGSPSPSGLSDVTLPSVPLQLSGARYNFPGWCAWLPRDRVYCWDPGSAPAPISGIPPGVRQLAGGPARGCVLVGSNLAECWGDDPAGDGVDSVGRARPIVFAEPIASLSLSSDFSCARAESGQAYCWGHNTWGQLGFAPLVSNVPVKLSH